MEGFAKDESVPSPTRPRKRRRSSTPLHIAEAEPSQKRPNLRKTTAPATKRAQTSNSNAKTSREQGVAARTRRVPNPVTQNSTVTASQGFENENNGNLVSDSHALQQIDEAERPFPAENATDFTEPHPDMHAVITKIIDHGENVENQYAARNQDADGLINPDSILGQGASSQLKIQSLPILENLVSRLPIITELRFLTLVGGTNLDDLCQLLLSRHLGSHFRHRL